MVAFHLEEVVERPETNIDDGDWPPEAHSFREFPSSSCCESLYGQHVGVGIVELLHKFRLDGDASGALSGFAEADAGV